MDTSKISNNLIAGFPPPDRPSGPLSEKVESSGGVQDDEIIIIRKGGQNKKTVDDNLEDVSMQMNVGGPGEGSLGVDPKAVFRENVQWPARGIETLKDLDVANPVDGLRLMVKSVKNFSKQFIEYGWKEKLNEQSPQRLKDLGREIAEYRLWLLEHVKHAVEDAEKALKSVAMLQSIAPEDGEAAIASGVNVCERTADEVENALDNLRVAMRNFRYNFDQESGRDISFGRKIGQFFSTTHTRLFAKITRNQAQRFDSDVVSRLRTLQDEFDAALPRGGSVSIFGVSASKYMSETAHQINEANRQLSNEQSDAFIADSARRQLQDIARNGGRMGMVISGGIGIGLKIAKLVDLSAMAKGRHQYMLSSPGDGSILVEHVLEFGGGARASVGVGEVARFGAEGELMGGFGRGRLVSKRFADLDSAVNYITKGTAGKWNPLLIKGRGVSKNFKAAWRRLASTFGSRKAFDERAFVKDMKKLKVLDMADSVLRRSRNSVLVERRTFSRIGGGLGGDAKVQTPLANIRFDVSASDHAYRDVWAKKTTYQTYLANIETRRRGKLVDDYLAKGRETETCRSLGLRDLLAADITDANDREEARQQAIDALKKMRTALDELEDEYASKLKKKNETALDRTDAQELAREYRDMADAFAAVCEFWESNKLADGVNEGEPDEYGSLCQGLRKTIQNPGVEFPEDVFNEELLVRVAENADGRIVNKLDVHVEIDFLTKVRELLLGVKGPLVDEGLSDLFSLTELGRVAGRTGTDFAGKYIPLQGGHSVEWTTTWPQQHDRRPWNAHKTSEVNLRLPTNVTTTWIALAVLKGYLDANNLPMPATGKELARVAIDSGIGMIASALKQFTIADGLAKTYHKSTGAQKETGGIKDYLGGENLFGKFIWDSGRNIQLKFEKGRLVSLSFGSHEKLDVRLDIGHIGVVGELGYGFDKVSNEKRWLVRPSFDSLARLCDDHLNKGNVTGLKMLAGHNRPAFVRMFDLMRVACRENRGNVDSDERSADDRSDIDSIKALRRSMADEVDKFGGKPGDREILRKNLDEFNAFLGRMAEDVSDLDHDEDAKTRLVLQAFTCISRHYQSLEALPAKDLP